MPNILFVEPHAFDPDLYEMVNPEEVEDHQLRMKVENTIRWRYEQGVDGQVAVQSNARFIEWSDGRCSLLVGDELLDVTIALTPSYQYLVSLHHDDNVLLTQAPLTHKMMFKPYGVKNKTHLKMASMLNKKFKRQPKTKIIDLDKNLELERQAQILAEQKFLKSQRKVELKKKSLRSKYGRDPDDHDEVDEAYGDEEEEDDDDDDDEMRRRMVRRGESSVVTSPSSRSKDRFGNGRGGGSSSLHAADSEDDLRDFIVEDDDEPQYYNEEEAMEELERAEQLLSGR
ncbi:Paf1 complex component, partial [Coelomomyces lativittatus]